MPRSGCSVLHGVNPNEKKKRKTGKKRILSQVHLKNFFIQNSFLKCKFFCRVFFRNLLIDLKLPILKMDFFELLFENFVDRF